MLRSVLGGIRRQGKKRTVMWSPDVEDNSKPLPDLPKEGMTDDEALKMSDEMAVIRRARKQAHAASRQENSDFAQIGTSSNKFFGRQALMGAASHNFTPQMGNNSKTRFNNLERTIQISENEKRLPRFDNNFVDQSNVFNLDRQTTFNIDQGLIKEQETRMDQANGFVDQKSTINGKFSTFTKNKNRRAFQLETQSFEDDSSIGQESAVGSLSDFAVDQAAQISKLTEDERKLKRALRFAQPSQNQKPEKVGSTKSRELEQLGMRVKDFVDTTKLYAQVQDAIISKTSNEMRSNESGRTRAWDYFDDGFKPELKNEARVESKVESLIVYQETPQVLENIEEDNESGSKLESDLILEIDPIPESDEPRDDANIGVTVVDDFPFVPVAPISDQSEKAPEITSVHYEEELIADATDGNAIVGNDIPEKSDVDAEEEMVPAFRFTTICDLRDEVMKSSSPQSRRDVSLKRKAAFKKAPIKSKNDRKPETEHSRRRKDRLAIFDANRANSITKVLNELDSAVDLDTPVERLFRLEHPEYFLTELSESREERLHEYEQARSAYETHVTKLMEKQVNRHEKAVRKRLRELEDEELLREAKKVARQKVQEEMGWIPPSDVEIWKWREQRGKLPLAEEDVYDEKESDEENVETYYNHFEELSEPSNTLRSSIRRNKEVLSYGELRRRARERERNKKVQADLAKMQETVRKCQIEDLRHQILEEERAQRRQKLVDLSNERDRRDAKAIQRIREVATSKIAIGRAIRELEDKIAAAETELSRKRRFEDMVNDQSVYMKCIGREELQKTEWELNRSPKHNI